MPIKKGESHGGSPYICILKSLVLLAGDGRRRCFTVATECGYDPMRGARPLLATEGVSGSMIRNLFTVFCSIFGYHSRCSFCNFAVN